MNKFVMYIWGLMIVCIFGVIVMIGYKEKNDSIDREYISYISNIKSASKKYIAQKHIRLKYNKPEIIFYNDLLGSKVIKDDENEYCIKSIIVTKGIIKDRYEINTNCEVSNETK